ncbi:MAG TPA: ATPase [Lentisphaeria bacterium]|nr:MAG: ATPase [Lentisphaerae bacterium GWF2_50_93]HCE43974.1 ATPase [Lentisphaeria bacterium]
MRIALPVQDGKLCMHFGHCGYFAIMDVDEKKKEIVSIKTMTPPPHEPGVLPKWIASLGVNLIIAGGMGSRAQDLFVMQDIKVVVGAPSEAPEDIVKKYLAGTLETGGNVCDH